MSNLCGRELNVSKMQDTKKGGYEVQVLIKIIYYIKTKLFSYKKNICLV